MEIKTVLKFMLILSAFSMAYGGYADAAKKSPPPSKKTVKGFRGEAKIMALQWLNKEKDFISLKFIYGNKGQFWDKGSLEGELSDGRVVSIDVANDFSDRTPGMIYVHLKALKFKAKTSNFSFREYKEFIAKKIKFHKKLAKEGQTLERTIKRRTEQQLTEFLEKELPAGERAILKEMKKELEPDIRRKIISEIADEVKKNNPNASAKKLNFKITAKLNKESRPRIKKRLQEKILAIKLDSDWEKPEIRKLVEKVVTYYRPNIESKVQALYALKRSNQLTRLIKISRGEPVKPLKKEKKESFVDKVKSFLSLN